MGFAGVPAYEAIAVPEDQILGRKIPKLVIGIEWMKWLASLVDVVDTAPTKQAKVRLQAQGASIGVTAIPLPSVGAGMWRVSYYMRITTPGTVSSSLTITIAWVDGGVAMSYSGAALVGNTTASAQFATLPIRSDVSSPITYATVYASAGATPMKYELNVVAEALALETV